MTKHDKRRHKRHRCRIKAEFSVYAAKVMKGTTALTNVSKGGLKFILKRAPLPESVIVIKIDARKLAKFIDFTTILLDPAGYPIVKVIHVAKNRRGKGYSVGVRFLPRPTIAGEGTN